MPNIDLTKLDMKRLKELYIDASNEMLKLKRDRKQIDDQIKQREEIILAYYDRCKREGNNEKD